MNPKPAVIESPDCVSVRECNARMRVIFSLENDNLKIAKILRAVRRNRGEPPERAIVLPHQIAIEFYVSNRGVAYVNFLYLPPELKGKESELRRKIIELLY